MAVPLEGPFNPKIYNPMTSHFVRLLADSRNNSSIVNDAITRQLPFWWSGNAFSLQLALAVGSTFLTSEDIGTITLEVKPLSASATTAPLVQKTFTAADCNSDFVGSQWDQAVESLLVAEFTQAEASLGRGRYRLLVVHTAPNGTRTVHLSTGIDVTEDFYAGPSVISPPPIPTEYYTREESDARFGEGQFFSTQAGQAVSSDISAHKSQINPHSITPALIGAASASELLSVQQAQSAGRVAYQTLSLLEVDLTPAENALAEVTNDGDNNGVYIKVGATGGGSWLKSTNDISERVRLIENGDEGYTGWHWVLVSGVRVIATWNLAGELLTNYEKDSISNEALQFLLDGGGYTGFSFVIVDESLNVTGGSYLDGTPIIGGEFTVPRGAVTIGCHGDSTSNDTYEPFLSERTGLAVQEYGWPGEKPHEIAGRFFAETTREDILIFWVGRNGEVEHNRGIVSYYLNKMIESLPSEQKWLVAATVPVQGEPFGGAAHTYLADARDHLSRVYRDRFVDLQSSLLARYDYGDFRLAAPFVQPALNAQVTITLNQTANGANGILSYANGYGTAVPPDDARAVSPEFYLGYLGEQGDRYRVDSVDSSTQVTCTLVSQVTATGATIANLPEASGYDLERRFVFYIDAQNFIDQVTARSMKSDNIHYGDRGNDLIAKVFQDRLLQLGWI